jgi:hypothetical protein
VITRWRPPQIAGEPIFLYEAESAFARGSDQLREWLSTPSLWRRLQVPVLPRLAMRTTVVARTSRLLIRRLWQPFLVKRGANENSLTQTINMTVGSRGKRTNARTVVTVLNEMIKARFSNSITNALSLHWHIVSLLSLWSEKCLFHGRDGLRAVPLFLLAMKPNE